MAKYRVVVKEGVFTPRYYVEHLNRFGKWSQVDYFIRFAEADKLAKMLADSASNEKGVVKEYGNDG